MYFSSSSTGRPVQPGEPVELKKIISPGSEILKKEVRHAKPHVHCVV